MSDISFGIDLGTTFSVAAYVDETGRPSIARNSSGAETTPSVVYFENETSVVVGDTAKRTSLIYPDRVVSRIKRSMGQKRNYQFDGRDYTPESISALILKQVAQDAGQATGHQVTQVVITVPAYFGMLERDATRKAGEIAGLDVAGIIPEPVAAALHYDAVTDSVGKTLLVYDLGGGTFDTTVIRIEADDIRVLCTDGDQELGGSDWDAALVSCLLAKFLAEAEPGEPPEEDQDFMQGLVLLAEETKIALSHASSRPVPLRFAGAAARVEVSRAEFEGLTQDLLDRTIMITRRMLDTLAERHGPTAIDEVLLVGGSAKMPAVASTLRAEFGWEPRLHEPDLAVARGAALYAVSRAVHRWREEEQQRSGGAVASLQDAAEEISLRTGIAAERLEQIASRQTRNVLPKAFGVELLDKSVPNWRDSPDEATYIEHLVHANDTLPTGPRKLAAATAYPDQQAVEIAIFEQAGAQESPAIASNHPVNDGAKLIRDIPPLPAGSPIDITMTVDAEGHLTVTAVEPASGKDLRIDVRVSVLSDEQVDAAKKVVSAITVSA
ncbi:MAG TPA: Hsp70 family protein [Streptosporangiaceae bacterium]|nr:Hsp70 family protein [Streptosporangiaceae bacterium]